jgi:cell division protein FtsX
MGIQGTMEAHGTSAAVAAVVITAMIVTTTAAVKKFQNRNSVAVMRRVFAKEWFVENQ